MSRIPGTYASPRPYDRTGFDIDRDVVIPHAIGQARYAAHLIEQAFTRPEPPPSFLRAIGLMACDFLELAILGLRTATA